MGHKITFFSGLALAASLTCVGSVPVNPVVRDVFYPPPAGAIHIGGRLGERLDQCIENRVLAQPIEPLVKPYRDKREEGSKDWRCEYWGKWFTSLALADAYRPTAKSKAKLDDAEHALLETAASDGYLGTRQPEYRLEGWDVWGRKYALLGLLAYYDRTGDGSALVAAGRHLDTLMAQTGPGKINIADVGEHKGLAASSILEPTVLLYRRTGDPKYLEYAQYIVGQWSKPSNQVPQCADGLRLIEDSLAGTPPQKMRWNKAYEMTSCFEGLCELYRVTGDRDYLDAPIRLAEGILTQETTIVGPGTSIEHWCGGHTKQTSAIDRPMETCVTATWMKFLYQLLRLTGDVRFADELERNLYNGLLGAQMPGGSWWAYFSGVNGERVPSLMQHDEVGLSCCVVSGPRALLLTPQWAAMTSAEGPVLNLYFPGMAELPSPSGQKITITQKTDYPVADTIEISLELSRPETFTLALRIPAWSERTSLKVNGGPVETRPGSYAKIRRTWKSGDRVQLVLDLRGRIIEAPDGNGQLAVVRGPLVLALDNRLVPDEGLEAKATLDRGAFPFIDLKPNPEAAGRIGAWAAFDVPFIVDGKARALEMCDFASAGNAWTTANRYRTWLPQPLWLGNMYESGQTWQTLTHRHYRPVAPENTGAGDLRPTDLPERNPKSPETQSPPHPREGFPALGGRWKNNPIPVLAPLEKPQFRLMVDADETGGRTNYAYAYSPTIIRENGRYHAFVGSPGDVGGKSHGEWDYIRYIWSDDGKNWSKPVVVLKAKSDKRGLDYSACDPSMVYFQGYYYLFYSGAENVSGPVSGGMDKKEVVETVVRVARSEHIEGPYRKWTRRGTWEEDAPDPEAIIKPLGDPTHHYGAGQQSVVVRDGKIWMWYLDDTGEAGKGIYLLRSDDPVRWTADPHAITDNGVVGLDVKFDPRTRLFWALALPRVGKDRPESAMVLSFSADGVSWPAGAKLKLIDIARMAHWVRVEGGISGDREGHIIDGTTLFSFPAPHGLADQDKVPVWDLYSFALENASERLLVSDPLQGPGKKP